jgi:hypothetical protein
MASLKVQWTLALVLALAAVAAFSYLVNTQDQVLAGDGRHRCGNEPLDMGPSSVTATAAAVAAGFSSACHADYKYTCRSLLATYG